MSGDANALAAKLEPFRAFLQLLVWLHLEPGLRAMSAVAGLLHRGLDKLRLHLQSPAGDMP
jgi:hypothetical protein